MAARGPGWWRSGSLPQCQDIPPRGAGLGLDFRPLWEVRAAGEVSLDFPVCAIRSRGVGFPGMVPFKAQPPKPWAWPPMAGLRAEACICPHSWPWGAVCTPPLHTGPRSGSQGTCVSGEDHMVVGDPRLAVCVLGAVSLEGGLSLSVCMGEAVPASERGFVSLPL